VQGELQRIFPIEPGKHSHFSCPGGGISVYSPERVEVPEKVVGLTSGLPREIGKGTKTSSTVFRVEPELFGDIYEGSELV
jgi:hypothetical protein